MATKKNGTSKRGGKAEKKTEKKVAAEPRTLVSHKDVSIAFLVGGMPEVEKILPSIANPGQVLRNAVKSLDKQGADSAPLLKMVEERFPVGTKGRKAPEVGTSRRYKVQALKDNDPFLRIPTALLGLNKGAEAEVAFENGQIVVRPASEDSTAEAAEA